MPRKSDENNRMNVERVITGLRVRDCVLKMTMVYDSVSTRQWAGELHARIEQVLGKSGVRCTSWRLDDLAQPGVLAGAVSSAIHADMIVVATGNSEGMQLPFYYWINAWLPHRVTGVGAVVALLGPASGGSKRGRLKGYLKNATQRARMDLIVTERCLDRPAALPWRVVRE